MSGWRPTISAGPRAPGSRLTPPGLSRRLSPDSDPGRACWTSGAVPASIPGGLATPAPYRSVSIRRPACCAPRALDQPRRLSSAATCSAVPSAPGPFHGAWACASLLHAPKPALPQALAEIRRVLVRRGILYLAMRAGQGSLITGQGTSHARVLTLYGESELEAALAKSGLRVVTLTSRKWPVGLDGGRWIHGFAVRD